MNIDFVSLSELIEKTYPRIEVAEEEVDAYSVLPDEGDAFELTIARYPAYHSFKRSRAAMALLNCLFNTSATLRWFDDSLPGVTLQSEEVRKEIRDALVRIAKEEQEFKKCVNRIRRLPPRWQESSINGESQPAPFLHPPAWPRSRDIGFERSELIGLLDANNISHNLGDLPPNAYEETEQKTVAQPLAATASILDKPLIPLQKKRRRFRGPLADILKMAQEAAADPNDPHSVWIAFKNIAQRKFPPSPIIGFAEDDQAVKWLDEEEEDEKKQIKYFKSGGMTRRFRGAK